MKASVDLTENERQESGMLWSEGCRDIVLLLLLMLIVVLKLAMKRREMMCEIEVGSSWLRGRRGKEMREKC